MNLSDLKTKAVPELLELAKEMGLENINRTRKQDLIFTVLKRHAKSGEDIYGDGVLEILQDGFVRVYAAIERVDVSRPLSPWLYRIVVNLSYNWMNHHRHWPLALDTLIEHLIAGPAASPEHVAEGSELRRIVWEAVASLSFKQRSAVVLFYLQGLSLQEIAYILDCPVGTIKSRLHYACKALRKKLSEDRRLTGEVAYGTSWR